MSVVSVLTGQVKHLYTNAMCFHVIFAATPKGSLLFQSCLGKIFAAMIGINPSPSSQFVPSPLHKLQRRREESQETKGE